MGDEGGLRNISDTAHWVAFYRALESERPDALFRDPFARPLAGAHADDAQDHWGGVCLFERSGS